MKVRQIPGAYSVARFDAASQAAAALFGPEAPGAGRFLSVTRTGDELSVVCESGLVPLLSASREERGWSLMMVEGPLDFALTGILSSISAPLAAADVSIFAVSTYDTDYVLVRERDLGAAAAALSGAGFEVVR